MLSRDDGQCFESRPLFHENNQHPVKGVFVVRTIILVVAIRHPKSQHICL